MVADHAILAAQAVAEAEEASKKASSLLDAANELEDLDHHTLEARHGAQLSGRHPLSGCTYLQSSVDDDPAAGMLAQVSK